MTSGVRDSSSSAAKSIEIGKAPSLHVAAAVDDVTVPGGRPGERVASVRKLRAPPGRVEADEVGAQQALG